MLHQILIEHYGEWIILPVNLYRITISKKAVISSKADKIERHFPLNKQGLVPNKGLVCLTSDAIFGAQIVIEVNLGAKPKPPTISVPLLQGGLYRLRNGIIISVYGYIQGNAGGRVEAIPIGLNGTMNPSYMYKGQIGHLWEKEHGRYCGCEMNTSHPYHVIATASSAEVAKNLAERAEKENELFLMKKKFEVEHANEPAELLWTHWENGGFLQWKRRMPNAAWKPYYDAHNAEGSMQLTYGLFMQHYQAYFIRRRP